MTDQKHHDSLAPIGAFSTSDASDTARAAASTASLVASQSAEDPPPQTDEEPQITVTLSAEDAEDLCADDLIPSGGERVSMENAMRALIDMRLEQTRPSGDFGSFELGATATTPLLTQPTTYQPAMNSLAPIELAPIAPLAAKPATHRRPSPFPYLAAAAVLLFGVGLYRRVDRREAVPTQSAHAASLDSAAPLLEPALHPAVTADAEEANAAQEITTLSVSESDDSILTLGTPTIVYVQEDAPEEEAAPVTESSTPAVVRASAHAASTVARTARVATPKPTVALPETPSREDIVAGFNSVRAEVLACANGGGGVAPIEATVVGSGHITHANVGGYYQGTPAGSCIARVLRKARFAAFSGESIKVSFPYTL